MNSLPSCSVRPDEGSPPMVNRMRKSCSTSSILQALCPEPALAWACSRAALRMSQLCVADNVPEFRPEDLQPRSQKSCKTIKVLLTQTIRNFSSQPFYNNHNRPITMQLLHSFKIIKFMAKDDKKRNKLNKERTKSTMTPKNFHGTIFTPK